MCKYCYYIFFISITKIHIILFGLIGSLSLKDSLQLLVVVFVFTKLHYFGTALLFSSPCPFLCPHYKSVFEVDNCVFYFLHLVSVFLHQETSLVSCDAISD